MACPWRRSVRSAYCPSGRDPLGSGQFWSAQRGFHLTAIDQQPRPIQQIRATQLGQEQLVDLLPNALGGPLVDPSRASLVRNATGFRGKVFPADAGLQHEQHGRQHRPRLCRRPPAIWRWLVLGKQLLDLVSQLVG